MPVVNLITTGPTVTRRSITARTINPKTASLFLSNRRQASRHSEVPFTCSLFSPIKLFVSYSRIQKAVGNVYDKIKDHDQYREERDDAENKRLIAVKNRLNKDVAKARDRKYLFDDDRTREQRRKRGTGKRHDRNNTAAKRMLEQHRGFVQPLSTSRADII